MKKLIALVAVLGYVPFAHAAEGDWTHSGEYRLQYTNNEATGFDKDAARTQVFHQRTKLNTTVRAGEKMTFNLGLVHNADWGSNPDQYPDSATTTTGTAPAADSTATNNLITVNEAYATWQATDEMTLKMGRIAQTFADGTVVSANDWQPVQKAFDAAGLIYDLEAVRIGAFAVRGGQSSTGSDATFGSFYGVSADLKTLPSFLKMVNLHYILVKRNMGTYELNGNNVAVDGEDANRIGLTVAGDAAGFDYRATYAMYTGKQDANAAAAAFGGNSNADIKADMMDLEVGYAMPAMMNFRVHAGYHMDSGDSDPTTGDDERYNGFHYDVHNNAGLMDVLGWGNLTYTRAGVAIAPMEDLTVAAEYFMFTKTEKADSTTDTKGALVATNANEDDLGTELDVTVTKKYTNNFAIQARYGMFTPGDAFTPDDTMTQVYLEGKLTF